MIGKLGPYELDTIVTGDARELARAVPDESVDLIFTDPVYDRIDDYRWLAETAARVLKPGGVLVTFVGIPYLPETIASLSARGMDYYWRIVYRILFGAGGGSWRGKLQAGTQEALIYSKGKPTIENALFDFQMIVRTQHGSTMRRNGSQVWGKPEGCIHPIINAFPGIVLDPFTGGGTVPAVCKMLRRRYLAFEIDPDTADLARERVANTQPPLPLDVPTQEALL